MIEWYNAKDKLPPYDMPVLVACKCGETYPEEVMFVMKRVIDEYGCDVWKCLHDYAESIIYDDDCWAIINQPKIEKDGDLY